MWTYWDTGSLTPLTRRRGIPSFSSWSKTPTNCKQMEVERYFDLGGGFNVQHVTMVNLPLPGDSSSLPKLLIN